MKLCWDEIEKLIYNKKTRKWYKYRYKNGRNVGGSTLLLNEKGCIICGEQFFYEIHNLGKCCSLSCNTKLRNSMYIMKEETKRKISKTKKGVKVHSEEEKKKISERMSKRIGPLNSNWKGGITSENGKIYNSKEYKQWRKQVFERDEYICQMCKEKGRLQAHHIKMFSEHKELRFDVNNGITLCKQCHTNIRCKEEDFEDLFCMILEKE